MIQIEMTSLLLYSVAKHHKMNLLGTSKLYLARTVLMANVMTMWLQKLFTNIKYTFITCAKLFCPQATGLMQDFPLTMWLLSGKIKIGRKQTTSKPKKKC